MVVTKTDYSLQPPWTYNDLRDKYMEILQDMGVMGVKLDEFTNSYGDWVVHKRTYNPSGSGTVKFPNCFYAFRVTEQSARKVQWFTNDGTWDASTHLFVPGILGGEGQYKTYYNTGASNTGWSTNYTNRMWIAAANQNELLPIYLYRSQEDPNFYIISIDNGAQGVSYYLPPSSAQLDPMIQLTDQYLFPEYMFYPETYSVKVRSNGFNFAASYNQHGYASSSYSAWSGSADQSYGDNDMINISMMPGGSLPEGFCMPDTHKNGSSYNEDLSNRYHLVRGVKYSSWMKNKTLPSDFGCLADYGITAQTRLGQPYVLNGNRYEVAAVNLSNSSAVMIVAQIT